MLNGVDISTNKRVYGSIEDDKLFLYDSDSTIANVDELVVHNIAKRQISNYIKFIANKVFYKMYTNVKESKESNGEQYMLYDVINLFKIYYNFKNHNINNQDRVRQIYQAEADMVAHTDPNFRPEDIEDLTHRLMELHKMFKNVISQIGCTDIHHFEYLLAERNKHDLSTALGHTNMLKDAIAESKTNREVSERLKYLSGRYFYILKAFIKRSDKELKENEA